MKKLGYSSKTGKQDTASNNVYNPPPKKDREDRPPKPDKKFYEKLQIDSLSVKEIKDILKKLNVSIDNCFEKADLIHRYVDWYKATFNSCPPGHKDDEEGAKKKKTFYNDTFNTNNVGGAKNAQNQPGPKINIKQFDPALG